MFKKYYLCKALGDGGLRCSCLVYVWIFDSPEIVFKLADKYFNERFNCKYFISDIKRIK